MVRMFIVPICDERTLHLLSHLRQVMEEYFNIIVVCKADVVGIKRINLVGGTTFCCRLPFLLQDSWFQHRLCTQKEDDLVFLPHLYCEIIKRWKVKGTVKNKTFVRLMK